MSDEQLFAAIGEALASNGDSDSSARERGWDALSQLRARLGELRAALREAKGTTTKDRDAFNAAFNRGFAGDALR